MENIELFLAQNPYSEIENVANNIIELVRDESYRYKDISIITKEIDEYDIIYSKDRLITYLISEALEPIEIHSRVYIFNSIKLFCGQGECLGSL